MKEKSIITNPRWKNELHHFFSCGNLIGDIFGIEFFEDPNWFFNFYLLLLFNDYQYFFFEWGYALYRNKEDLAIQLLSTSCIRQYIR